MVSVPSNNSMKSLLDSLMNSNIIKSQKVYDALLQVDRAHFTKTDPYKDSPQYLGYNATISAPHMHAYALEYLYSYLPSKEEEGRVLDIGSGSGYLAVAFSKLMHDKGLVVGIEHIEELFSLGYENINKNYSTLLQDKKIILVSGDGRKGYTEHEPYNVIHVGAAAETIPDELIEQLAPGGRLMIPVGKDTQSQFIELITKSVDGERLIKEKTLAVSYVPLTSVDKQLNKGVKNI